MPRPRSPAFSRCKSMSGRRWWFNSRTSGSRRCKPSAPLQRFSQAVMRSQTGKLLALLLLLSVAVSSVAAEGRRNRNRDAEGFEFIFNGVDLRGWKGDTNFWFVQGSNIVGRIATVHGPKANTFLIWTNGTVGDFELRAAFKI